MDDLYKPSNKIVENAHINKLKYEEMYKESISNPIKFWGEHGKRIDWIKNYDDRKDEFSRKAHQKVYENFAGTKQRIIEN